MIEDLYLSPVFWLAVGALATIGCVAARSRPLSFGFIAIVLASQYAVHSAVTFGVSSIFWFCAGFWVLLIASLHPRLLLRLGVRPLRRARPFAQTVARAVRAQESVWLALAKIYLVFYGLVRLSTYPWLGGELDIAMRLEASMDNRFVFILSLAILPPIAAIATQWLRRGYVLGVTDWIVAVFTSVALVTSGSKATIIPAVIAIIGAAYLTRRPLRSWKFFAVAGAVVAVVSAAGYAVAVAAGSVQDAIAAILFRLAANTDSLEYLRALGVAPQDYPYAGVGALLPTLARRFGYEYAYPPGVWLHGERYDQWQGFGPNPGIVMDYFGNLWWFGLLAAVVIGVYAVVWTRVGGAVGAAFGCATYLALTDVTLFGAAVLPWAVVLVICLLLDRFAGGRVRASGPVTRITQGVSALPVWLVGGFRSTVRSGRAE